MTQTDFGTIVATTKTGTALASDLNAWRDTVHSGHSGTAQPSYVVAGMLWVDSTSTDYVLKLVNAATGDVALGILDNTNSVIRVAVDADADSYISAATDDEIRVRLGGTDRLDLTAAGFKFLAATYDFLDSNGNQVLRLTETASAVNYVELINSATANDVVVAATGTDANLGLNLTTKGTGTVQANGTDVVADYATGTWTPAYTGAGGAPTIAYTTQTGRYTQRGRLLKVDGYILVSTVSGGSGGIQITGLPTAPAATALGYTPGVIGYQFLFGAVPVPMVMLVDQSAGALGLYVENIGALGVGALAAGCGLYFSAEYEV